MLNRSALSHSIPPAIAPAIKPAGKSTGKPVGNPAGSASNDSTALLNRARWSCLMGAMRLPSSLRGYMAFLASLLVLAFTMTLHIMLSAEIMRLNVQLYSLQSEHERVERYNANIVWEIAQRSSLVDLNKEALVAGYVNSIPTEYVDMPAATAFSAPVMAPGSVPSTGAQGAQPGMGAIDATVTDPSAPQPQFVVIPGEPATSDSPFANGQTGENGSADSTVYAPRVGALAVEPSSEPRTAQEPAWWQGYVPEWLRFNRVGDAVNETVGWIRERLPSGQWLQERW